MCPLALRRLLLLLPLPLLRQYSTDDDRYRKSDDTAREREASSLASECRAGALAHRMPRCVSATVQTKTGWAAQVLS